MENKYKFFLTGLIPYLTICGGLWNWAYWSMFDINIFLFIDVTDIVKSFILPLLSSAALFFIGQVFAWFFLSDHLPYGGGSETKAGIFLRRYSKLIAFIWLGWLAALLALNEDPNRWIVVAFLLMLLLGVPLMETGLLADTFPNQNLRVTILATIAIVPILSFGQGKFQAEKIFRNQNFKIINKEIIKQINPTDTLTYKFLGVGGDYMFGVSLDNHSTILLKKSEFKTILIEEWRSSPEITNINPSTPSPAENYFEGVIVYEHKYETTNPSIDVEGFAVKYGTKSEFYFKDGNYKQIFNGTMLKSNLFLNKDNKIYGQTSTSDTLFFTDCSQPIETIVVSDILKNKDTVIDRSCNVLSIKTNDLSGKFYRNTFYYFDPTMKIDPAWFKNVKYASHDKIYALTNSLPLKIVNHLADLTVSMTALSVKKQKVDDKFFEITKGVITAPQK